MPKKKKNLLLDIVASDQLTIELVFGKAVWEKFLEFQPDVEIVGVGNGPVCSYNGEYIENAKMVMRCNHYQKQTKSGEGRRKLVQNAMCNSFVSVAKSSEHHDCVFLYDWCRRAKVVLALESTDDRKQISKAIKAQQLTGDPIMSKICLPAKKCCRESLRSIVHAASTPLHSLCRQRESWD